MGWRITPTDNVTTSTTEDGKFIVSQTGNEEPSSPTT